MKIVKKMLSSLILSILLLGFSPAPTNAVVNPIETPNNRFGIHILDESDLEKAHKIVNSSGGEWGYVTLVIREDQMNTDTWNKFFKKLKDYKLIPIVRIATTQNNGSWPAPRIENAEKWAEFLSSLNWPTKNRYVILFNEPNHAKEWGGQINPEEYAQIARRYWEELKKQSFDFFILPAALDLNAPNSSSTMDAELFYQRMFNYDDWIFTIFDGLNSHSYPNPAFCGSPKDYGRSSIQGFKWEIEKLSHYYMQPDIPVFITETGWACPNQDLTTNYKTAFNEIWNTGQIVAVTPFLLNYQEPPFSNFSWTDPNTGEFRSFVQSIIDIAKTKGEPQIIAEIEKQNLSQRYQKHTKNILSYVFLTESYEDLIINSLQNN